MKLFVLGFVFLISSAFAQVVIPQGRYVGKGEIYASAGRAVSFDIESEVTNTGVNTQTIVDTYYFRGQAPATYEYDIRLAADGRLSVSRNGQRSGKGYCLEDICHLSFNFRDTRVMGEETVIVNGSTLKRIGTRSRLETDEQFVKTTLRLVH